MLYVLIDIEVTYNAKPVSLKKADTFDVVEVFGLGEATRKGIELHMRENYPGVFSTTPVLEETSTVETQTIDNETMNQDKVDEIIETPTIPEAKRFNRKRKNKR